MSHRASSFRRVGSLVRLAALSLAIAAFALGDLARAAQSAQVVFGPRVYAHPSDRPLVLHDAFSLAGAPSSYVLRVENGDRRRQQRVSAVAIDVNGASVVLADEIDTTVGVVERPVALVAGLNRLRVEIAGPEVGFVAIEIRDVGALVPTANAGSDQRALVGTAVQLDGSGSTDPLGLPLTYQWSFASVPGGSSAALSNPASPAPSFVPDVAGLYAVQLVVGNGVSAPSAPASVNVTASLTNNTPVPDAGGNQVVDVGTTVQLDGSGSFDPDGDPITYAWDLSSRPPGSSSILSGATTATPTFVPDVAGIYVANLAVSDGLATSSPPDRVRVVAVQPAQVTVPNVIGMTQADAQHALLAAQLSLGSVSSALNAAVPAGSVGDQAPTGGSTVPVGAPVDLTISLGPPVDITPPAVQVTATPPIVAIGGSVALAVTATDNAGVATLALDVNGVNVPLDPNGNATYLPAAAGLYTAIATATDVNGLSATARARFQARTAADDGPPVVALTSPAEDAILEVETDLVGTASDSDLVLYELQAARAGSASFVTFATGFASVTNGVLARLNPGAFTPGVYDVRVCATDSWGNQACSAAKRYEISSERRLPGLMKLAFLDGFADVVGLPITVRRVYDGADKTVGDFGVGWHLETQDVKLETTRVMGSDWEIVRTGTIVFTYYLVPSKDHRANVFLPDGTVHRFRMRPDPNAQVLFPIDFLNGAFFDPLPGTTSTLTPNEQPCFVLPVLSSSGPVEIFDCDVELYEPSAYTLALPDGRVLSFVHATGRTFRLASIADTNGNVVTIGPNGISHSAGVAVSMVRDGLGRITSITNPDGQTRTYAYDARGDLVTATDYGGNATQFRYDDSHNLVQVIDPRGFTPGTLIYNDNGQIVAMIDSQGNRVDIAYDESTNQQIVTDRLGHTTISTFDDAGNLISFVDALGNQTTATYDADGNLLSQTDPLGNTQSFTYDADGRLVTHTDANGNTSSRTFDAAGRVTSVVDRMGHTSQMTYDPSGNLAQVTFPGGRVFTLQHDSNGTVLNATDPAGGVVSFTYDAAGKQTSFTDPLGRATTTSYRSDGQLASSSFTYNGQPVQYAYSYDANGAIEQVTLPDGTTGQVDIDGAGLPTQTTDVLGRNQQMVHDAEGNLLTLSEVDDRATAYEYDAEDRATAAELPGGLRVERTLDPLGRPTLVTLPSGAQASTQFDAAGRIVSQQRTGEGARTYAYDPVGNLTHATAPDGGVTTHFYDANGRRTSTTDPLGATTLFQYDALDNLTQTTLPDGAVVKNEFDALGRLTAIEDPTGARAEFSYDAASQIVSTLDPAGGVTTFTRDGIGEIASLSTPAGNTWGFTYSAKGQKLTQSYPWGGTQLRELDALGRITKLTDPTGDFGTFTYDGAGRLLSTTSSAGDLEIRGYDAAGQIATVTDNGDTTVFSYGPDAAVDRVDYPDGSFVQYGYDAAGRIASIQTPGGTTTYGYDTSGRLVSANDSALGATTYTYDLAGRVSQMTLPDGSVTSVTRDVRGSITGIDTTVGPTVLRDTTYTYDAAGKLTQATEIGRNVDYQYDAAGRVVSEVRTGSDAGTAGYAYDANWSLTQIGARALTYDGTLRLASDGVFTQYTYDAGGRPIARSSATVTEQFFYDALGRMIRVERTGALPAIVDLDYDHAGLLRRVVADGVGRTLLWDSLSAVPRLLEERDDNGGLIRRLVYGLGPVGVFDGAGHVLHRDPTGSVRVVTAMNGTVESDYAFSAYGEQTLGASNAASPLRFAGELAVPELGLYFLRSRFYDPVAGRFFTPDLLEPTATAWLTFNPYQYGNGNPVSFRDPLGNFSLGSVSISISIAGILAGLAINIFPSPLEWIVTALQGAPPESSFPVGAEAGVKLTFPGPGTAGVWSLQIGTKLKVLVSPAMSMLTWSLDAGAGLAIPPPAALISKGPSASASVGVVFGEQNGPPKTPGISASLQISGTAADRIANKYTRSIKAIGVLGNVGTIFLTTVQGTQQFQKSSAAISFKIGQPTPDRLREIFTISLSANQNPSAAGTLFASWTSAWGGLMGPTSSTYSPGYLTGSFYFTAGLAFTVSFPIVYFTWDGSSLNGGVPDYTFID